MWIISNALMKAYGNSHCSQALEEESWAAECMDGEPCAQSSGNRTQLAYLPPDKMTAFSRLSRFGMTFKPLTADLGEELLTLFRAASLARIYPVQEEARELKEADQECGNTWHELLMKYDPDSHSWRTVRCLFPEELQWSSVTLPTWGMTVNGALFQHQTAVRPISATGFGSKPNTLEKLPTPQASDYISKATSATWKAKGRLNYSLSNPEIQRMWPKPTCNMISGGPNHMSPSVQAGKHGMNLTGAIALWPTPTAHMAKETNAPSEALRNEPSLTSLVGGVLNADWVEWLMGWPIGWTKLEPLESFTEFDETWWDVEPVPRVSIGATARADRLKAIGNGQVSIAAATAWQILGKQ